MIWSHLWRMYGCYREIKHPRWCRDSWTLSTEYTQVRSCFSTVRVRITIPIIASNCQHTEMWPIWYFLFHVHGSQQRHFEGRLMDSNWIIESRTVWDAADSIDHEIELVRYWNTSRYSLSAAEKDGFSVTAQGVLKTTYFSFSWKYVKTWSLQTCPTLATMQRCKSLRKHR